MQGIRLARRVRTDHARAVHLPDIKARLKGISQHIVDPFVVLQDGVMVIPHGPTGVQAGKSPAAEPAPAGQHSVENRLPAEQIKLVIAQTAFFNKAHPGSVLPSGNLLKNLLTQLQFPPALDNRFFQIGEAKPGRRQAKAGTGEDAQ